jgi:hypothetical protein
MVDDPAVTGEESEDNKKSGPSGETAQLVVDGVNILAGHRPAAASVPTASAASDASAAASVETAAASGAVAEAASALGDAAGAVGDVADAAGSVVGSVLGILDGL